MEPLTKTEKRYLALAYPLLFLFAWQFNTFVHWLERNELDRGFTAILVVFGTTITVLIVTPIITFRNALILLGAFSASGFPMTAGSIHRHLQSRQKDREFWQEVNNQIKNRR